MRRWVIADTHFGHSKLVEEEIRPPKFGTKIIKAWGTQVSHDDLLIHLGDVAIPDSDKDLWMLLAGLPGKKILVMGNHDKRSATWYMKRGWSLACDAFELGGVLFTHEPRDERDLDHVNYNVHGHLHEGTHRPFDPSPKHRLVALEKTGYGPILLDRVLRSA